MQISDEMTYPTLREANVARQKEWDQDNQISLAYRGNELAGEVGEACNVIKKLERERMGIRGSRATKEQLAEELADVVICADLIAMQAGIDLDEAVRAKFNATSEKVGLKTRLTAALTLSGWRTIDSAPKDGTVIDLLYPYPRGRFIDARWDDKNKIWYRLLPRWGSQPGLGIEWHLLPESEWNRESLPNIEPTHWAPRPAPPATAGKEG